MATYPGYTVERIEGELSPRVANALLAVAQKEGSVRRDVARILAILARVHGIEFIENVAAMSDEQLLSMLQNEGML